ncbi:SdiA-regulated domain-containing protein [Mesonia maritima]|uniref:Uncharacterized protein YjiK n=1 Tax=Mesonia maritima TaxID=1793873 RepID=A0ABU1K935_9FLAO|nr:SdiA-regulated domain-containing protein [Mesonia maritima]MDR6302116.1 uncharacterized protein YjiK [Mesonia maritima]
MKSYFKSPPFFITLGILVFVVAVYFLFRSKYEVNFENPTEVNIVTRWEMPKLLEEISGIAYIDENHIAAIQDEDGYIFIFNLASKKIERKFKFAEAGDYEGITLVGNTAFVLRSDARIFEVSDITSDNPSVIKHETPLTDEYDFEGICYDKKHNRLLLAFKEENPDKSKDYKSIYEFALDDKRLKREPVFTIKYDSETFKKLEHFGDDKVFNPSEIGINPVTEEIYVLDGVKPKLLILDKNFKEKRLYVFDPGFFAQPEGLTFSEDGKLFIANEGGWNPGNILEVLLGSTKLQKK